MDTQYGIAVTNKFELFINEDADPFDILAQQEAELKKKQDTKEKVKTGKNKSAKKNAVPTEKAKVVEPQIPKKEGNFFE